MSFTRHRPLISLVVGAALPLGGIAGTARAASDNHELTAAATVALSVSPPVVRLAQASPGSAGRETPAAQAAPTSQAPDVHTQQMTEGLWTVTCRQTGSQPKSCSAILRVLQDPNQQLVLLWQIDRAADGTIQTIMQTPTGVLVQKGVDLKIGDDIVARLDYFACVPQNCEASGKIDEALGKKLAIATEVTVTVHARDGRDVHFRFSVKGLDKALEAVRS